MVIGHSRKGAIDLLQKEAAVSGLFFNESVENDREGSKEREREKERADGKMDFSVGKWNFERTVNLRKGVLAVIRVSVILW